MSEKKRNYNCSSGYAWRFFLAFVLSWAVNHSFWWGILHGFLGGIYLIYWVVKHSNIIEWIQRVLIN